MIITSLALTAVAALASPPQPQPHDHCYLQCNDQDQCRVLPPGGPAGNWVSNYEAFVAEQMATGCTKLLEHV